MIGMTAGAPLAPSSRRVCSDRTSPASHSACVGGSPVGQRSDYLWINNREEKRTAVPKPRLSAGVGSSSLGNRYLRLIAILVVLLNVVNTTGEYLIAGCSPST
jgi:hypothetical protein